MKTVRPDELPADLRQTVAQIAALAREPRYLGAVIFGSVARGCATPQSDLDVKVSGRFSASRRAPSSSRERG